MPDHKKYTDKELKVRIAQSDISAFDQLFIEMYPPLFILTTRMIKDEESAKDVVSETFMHLWESRNTLPDVNDLKAYLYISARNRTLDFLKKQKRSQQREEKALDEEWLAVTSENFIRQLLGIEKTRILYAVIRKLPSECSKVVLLGLEGYQPKEIADRLSISVSAVSNQKNRAIKLLRKKLDPGFLLNILL